MIPVTAIMIAYNNEDRSLQRLQRDLSPAINRHELKAELIVVDNSEHRSDRLAAATEFLTDGYYCWHQGRNLMYGPALNYAANIARHPYLLYVCTNHGFARDPTWPLDLLEAVQHPQVAMAGCLQDSGPPEDAGFPADLPHIHVQGGVFAARTEVLRAHPYPEDGPYVHWGADIVMSFALMKAGYELVDVPTIKSVWRTGAGDGHWKYVHDES
jgi:hypothetical protein